MMDTSNPNNNRREDGRLDPEALLHRYKLRDSDVGVPSPTSLDDVSDPTPGRGRLRVYLGASAGVGKTYAMLNEGRRRKERGTNVVIGYVETHKRQNTAEQIGDLEIVPRKKIEYRGVILEEMDTDAVIARHPQVVLVDELAHTNVSGSKHRKRYKDVQELLDASIDVITTLNVQHLESLNDLVENITGIRVRETLPDSILDQADEVELVDIAPSALRQRMLHGNIYPPERIEPALKNFFREGNLTALREIALRLTANKAESQLQAYMTGHAITGAWATNERVLVGFDHRVQSRLIIRDAWRLAHGLHADLVAVSIELEGYTALQRQILALLKYGSGAKRYLEEAKQRLEEHALFAEDLGAEVVRLKSQDIATALAQVSREQRITQLVIGQPTHTRLEEFFFGSVVNKLLRLHVNVDIHVVPLERAQERES
ncbi:universal stress protein [Ktedonobacter sp. SOSP1-52]|uniref:universal stress protein n=1 Tax=Ktedonobacter sp. SOSP1-52 TaxID=2778366 RepID=UPI001F4891CE|nr:universal stress protein [Ktedonobacter sp. SOSP1-52]